MGLYDTEIWAKLDDDQCESFLNHVNPVLSPLTFDKNSTTIKSTDLSFYDEYRMYQITDFDAIPTLRKYVIYNPNTGDVVPITWTNEPIYALNKKAPIIINEETVTDYVKFFFHYVRGRHGRFIIVDHVDDIQWKEAPPTNARKALNDLIKPVEIVKKGDDSAFTLMANMVFKDSLFKTMVHVSDDGKTALNNEEVLIEAMPVLVDPI